MAWAIIALISYYERAGENKYLEAAKTLGEWIETETRDERGDGGYTGGYDGWESTSNHPEGQTKILWKSTENNIHVYVAFMRMYKATKDIKWKIRALYAKNFVKSMWNGSEGHFWTGTLEDGVSINTGNIPVDIQAWAVMAMCGYQTALNWAENNCYTETDGFKGFDFNNDLDGVWFEGTAHMAIAYQVNDEINKSDVYIIELRKAQNFATNTNGKGIVAASHDGVTTGFGWEYFSRLHIGATAWYIFAEMKNNPFWGESLCPKSFIDVPPEHWAYDHIYAIYNSGITTGYRDCTYRPASDVNRAQMAVYIIRALYGENFFYDSSPHFPDVPETHWAFKYIQKLYEDGISTGYPDGTYGSARNVNRAQMAVYIIRALYSESFPYDSSPHFPDVPEAHWAFKFIQKLYEDGISTGFQDGTYRPGNMVSRDQMAAYVVKGLFPAFPYSVAEVNNCGLTEHRFNFKKHHFMSLIDEFGTLILRPHPGVDINGWGSSWYIQPFIPKSSDENLHHSILNPLTLDSEGIYLNASGDVSYGQSPAYGTWDTTLNFNYNQTEKKIAGNGEYSITLDGTLGEASGDLNLYRIASNYLDEVPLLDPPGGIGDTGDMERVDVDGDGSIFPFTWYPPSGSYCPQDITDYISIDVIGQYNNVDTEAQGYDPIEPAYKPSLKVSLTSQQAGLEMIFCGFYDEAKSQDFWEDNVGIVPLILNQSTKTDFNFNVEFGSEALPGDGQ
jgi:hypothetical protein